MVRVNQHVMVLQRGISKFIFQPPVIRNKLIGKMQEASEYVIHNPQQFQGKTTQLWAWQIAFYKLPIEACWLLSFQFRLAILKLNQTSAAAWAQVRYKGLPEMLLMPLCAPENTESGWNWCAKFHTLLQF